MKEGDIVLTPLPQSDGRLKNRPTILLHQMPPFGDFLVCGVSSQLQQEVAGFDEIIDSGHADYAHSGLKTASLIRLGFLAVLPADRFIGRVGSIPLERHRRLLSNLCDHLRPAEDAD